MIWHNPTASTIVAFLLHVDHCILILHYPILLSDNRVRYFLQPVFVFPFLTAIKRYGIYTMHLRHITHPSSCLRMAAPTRVGILQVLRVPGENLYASIRRRPFSENTFFSMMTCSQVAHLGAKWKSAHPPPPKGGCRSPAFQSRRAQGSQFKSRDPTHN
jgi:hypothetical protein